MTTTELVTELVARGAEDNTLRNEAWINLAYKEIWNAYEWPFTEAEVTGTANAGFVTIPTDFRKAIYVGDASKGSIPGGDLDQITMAELREDYNIENFATTGSPAYWYMDNVAGQIKTYPFGGTVYVRYWKRATTVTGAASPAVPAEYHLLIVDRAMVEVYKDNDEQGNAEKQLAFFDRQLRDMAEDYGVISRDPDFIQAGIPYDG